MCVRAHVCTCVHHCSPTPPHSCASTHVHAYTHTDAHLCIRVTKLCTHKRTHATPHTHMCTHTQHMSTHAHPRLHTCTPTHTVHMVMHTCAHSHKAHSVYAHVHIHAHTAWTHTRAYTCARTPIWTHTRVFMRACVHTTGTPTHTHANTLMHTGNTSGVNPCPAAPIRGHPGHPNPPCSHTEALGTLRSHTKAPGALGCHIQMRSGHAGVRSQTTRVSGHRPHTLSHQTISSRGKGAPGD